MKKIVLIEDDSAIRDVFSLILDPDRYKLFAYSSGKVILENQVVVPDIFMLDKNIAGTDGLDLCRFIKASDIYNNTPVIILSASPNIGELAEKAGADASIAKPFTLQSLQETIDKFTSQ